MLNFPTKTEKTAKSVDEAMQEAMRELNVTDRDEVDVEIIEEATKGFLGLGSKDAHVKVSIKDKNAATAKNFLSQMFAAMNLEVNIEAKTEDNELKLNLSGDNMGIVIGKRGDTLDSIQYLTSLIVNHESDNYIKVIVDTENYREKREESLLALAARLAAKVARTGKKYTLEPMNPYERRIIHASLQSNEDVTTFSVGEDPYRKVVISPKNAPKNTGSKKPYRSSAPHESAENYAESYMNYKKTAPRHDYVKKAENFEAYQNAHEQEDNSEE